MPRFNSRVNLQITSERYRLADPDGTSAKAAIDAIVRSGILADDSPKQIEEVRFTQVKIKKPKKEKTIITITSIEEEIVMKNIDPEDEYECPRCSQAHKPVYLSFMYGCGWDYDRHYCPRCNYEKEYQQSTYPK